jgi:hypothetical protein
MSSRTNIKARASRSSSSALGRTNKTDPSIPPLLASIAHVLDSEMQTESLARALAAARGLAQSILSGDFEPIDAIGDFIVNEAARDSTDLHAKISQAPNTDDVLGSGHSVGEFYTLYSDPAVMLGMALAYVILTNDGGAR